MTDLTRWLEDLEARHLADLTVPEVTRALRALSSTYVERRERLSRRSAFDTAGKRAAYALYYSPLHFLTMQEIARALDLAARPVRHILDIGCGGGASGAAWSVALPAAARVTGLDTHPWALSEAAATYRSFGIEADTRRIDAARIVVPSRVDGVVAGWMLNEIDEAARAHLQEELLRAAERGAQVLIVEPIATRVSPWWPEWSQLLTARGGRADEWRLRVRMPEAVRRFGRAAGLRQDELTARSLYVARGAG